MHIRIIFPLWLSSVKLDGWKRLFGCCFKYLPNSLLWHIEEGIAVLTQRNVLSQCMCVRCQCRCICSSCPENNVFMFTGPVFQLESPMFGRIYQLSYDIMKTCLVYFQFQGWFSSLCGVDRTLSTEIKTEGRVHLLHRSLHFLPFFK